MTKEEEDARKKLQMEADREAPKKTRTPIRTAITRQKNKLEKLVRDNDPSLVEWGPTHYAQVACIKSYLEPLGAGLAALDMEILATFPDDIL
jgi:hypothetical protein